MLSGHSGGPLLNCLGEVVGGVKSAVNYFSGGPLLNCLGEVVGWSVRSNFDPVVAGAGFYAAGLNEVRLWHASGLRPKKQNSPFYSGRFLF